MSFAPRQQQAEAAWQTFEQSDRLRILVGSATCGRAAGSLEVMQAFADELAKHGLTQATDMVEVGCLGMCYAEVMVEIRGRDGKRVLYQGVEPRHAAALIEAQLVRGEVYLPLVLAVMTGADEAVPTFAELPMIKPQVRIVLRNCGVIDPTNIDHYLARGGYQGMTRAFAMGPE